MLPAPFSSPAHSLPARALLGLLRAYRLLLSPWLGSACRFEPTCSRYAIEAVETHGAACGGYLALRRLSRCHPWCEGGCDPVPMPPFRLFTAPDEKAGLPPSASRKTSS